MKLVLCGGNLTYYASIMLDAFYAYYAQNYAGIIGSSLLMHVCVLIVIMPTIKISCRSDLYTML